MAVKVLARRFECLECGKKTTLKNEPQDFVEYMRLKRKPMPVCPDCGEQVWLGSPHFMVDEDSCENVKVVFKTTETEKEENKQPSFGFFL